jgi:cell division protein FtsZ
MTLFEVDEAANRIREEVDPDANIIFGSTFDESLNGKMRVSVVSTGIEAEAASEPRPNNLSLVHSRPAARPAPGAKPAVKTAATMTAAAAEAAGQATAAAIEAAAERASAETGAEAEAEVAETIEEVREEIRTTAEEVHAEAEAEVAAGDRAEAEPEAPRDAFVPPAPSMPERKSTAAAQPAGRPDPFAAADMANASHARTEKTGQPAAPRNKAYSLFRRVTGGFGAAYEEAEKPAAQPQAPAHGQVRREPTIGRSEPQAPAKPSEPAAQANPAAESRQPKLSGMEPAPTSKDEEDLLDIPAFLRRQAN